MHSCISAIGIANPQYRIPQETIYQFMVKAFRLGDTDSSRLKKIYDNSGIDYRYSVLPDFSNEEHGMDHLFPNSADLEPFPGTRERLRLYQQSAVGIAATAAGNCFNNYHEDVIKEITHLITVSCTGMYAPGIDIELVEKLGLNRNIERTCINFMGCYGALNALKSADYICRSDAEAKVLIVCIELCTLHFQKENTLDNWVANSLFSDGAAAVLVENSQQRLSEAKPALNLKTFYSEFVPEAHNEMGWYVGDMGFEMKLTSKVSKLIKTNLKCITDNLLRKAGLTFEDIKQFAVHPGGKKILEAAETSLGFPPCANKFGYEVLRDYGNMSSATVLFVLKKILENGHDSHRDHILGFAFGPGLTVESMILQKIHYA